MKRVLLIVGICLSNTLFAIAQQRVVAECTVQFKIIFEDQKTDKDVQNAVQLSNKIVYIKGNDCRIDLMSPSLNQSIIYEKLNGSAVVLREFGNNKFMTKLSPEKWTAANKQYNEMTISLMDETKTILGYDCKKAKISLKDGSVYIIFYATSITPSVKEFEYPFRDIPGFVLEYQIKEVGETIVNYKAVKINLSPVQASKFDIPTSGYRILN
jgi:GLPGLI family protein